MHGFIESSLHKRTSLLFCRRKTWMRSRVWDEIKKRRTNILYNCNYTFTRFNHCIKSNYIYLYSVVMYVNFMAKEAATSTPNQQCFRCCKIVFFLNRLIYRSDSKITNEWMWFRLANGRLASFMENPFFGRGEKSIFILKKRKIDINADMAMNFHSLKCSIFSFMASNAAVHCTPTTLDQKFK